MKTNKNQIQTNYFDALFFANATSTEKLPFHISPAEFKLMIKLVHYHNDQKNITWSSDNISKHTSMSIGVIDKSIQRLKQKGYINTSTYNTDTYTKHRTIFINWVKIEEVNKLYLESIDNKPQTQNKAPESTIISQPIPEVQKQEIVSEIEDKPIQIDNDYNFNIIKTKWDNNKNNFDYYTLCDYDEIFKEINKFDIRPIINKCKLQGNSIEILLEECNKLKKELANQKELV